MTVDPMTSPSPSNCPSVTHSQVPSRLEITELWIQLFRSPANCLRWKKTTCPMVHPYPGWWATFGHRLWLLWDVAIFEGRLEVKLPTISADGKAEVGRVKAERVRRKKISEEKVRKKKVRKKKVQVRGKAETSRNTVFFQCFGAQEGRKVGSLKRRVWSHLGEWEMNNCTPLWREADLEVKRPKTP